MGVSLRLLMRMKRQGDPFYWPLASNLTCGVNNNDSYSVEGSKSFVWLVFDIPTNWLMRATLHYGFESGRLHPLLLAFFASFCV